MKPDGTVVQDWTNAQHLEDGVYVLHVALPKGAYIVLYQAEYLGMKTFGADTVMVVDDRKVIVDNIKSIRTDITAFKILDL